MKASPPNFLDETVSAATLAVFGKHPLAADHLEDIGLATNSLISFKQGMYIAGIGDCLSRQLWAKDLEKVDNIPYDHQMLCCGEHGWLAARLTNSADAAGRSQYPLVLALHTGDFELLHQIGAVVSILDATLEKLRSATELSALHQARCSGMEQTAALAVKQVAGPSAQARESWLQHMPGIGADREGLWRCCHALLPEGAGAGRARVPLHSNAPWPSATLWASLLSFLGARKPLTIIWRHGQSFADIWLSPPGSRVLASLFADEKSHPITTQVPFNVSQPLRTKADTAVKAWLTNSSLFEKIVDSTSNGVLNKVCQNMLGWFKGSEGK